MNEKLIEAIVESVLELTDEEILAECREQGVDPDEVAASMEALFRKALFKHREKYNASGQA